MTLNQIKKQMLAYTDFYGGFIPDIEEIKNAKSKEELEQIMEKHRSLLEDSLCDAMSHLDNFKTRIGLTCF